jgi:hypothetical protein
MDMPLTRFRSDARSELPRIYHVWQTKQVGALQKSTRFGEARESMAASFAAFYESFANCTKFAVRTGR